MSESTIWEYFNFNTGDIFINIGIVFIIAGIALMIFIRKNIVFKNIKLFSRANIFLGAVFFIIILIFIVVYVMPILDLIYYSIL